MTNSLTSFATPALSMSTREIAELTGKLHHHVLRDFREVCDALEITDTNFGCSYTDGSGRSLPMYSLPKDMALILVSGYSIPMRSKIIKRWLELEALKPSFEIPTTLVEALRLALEGAEKLEAAMVQVEAMKPAVEFVERYTGTSETQTLTDVAKTLGIRVGVLTSALIADGIVFRKGGKGTVYPYAEQVVNGRFVVKQYCPDGVNYSYTSMAVTPKGALWLTQQYGN